MVATKCLVPTMSSNWLTLSLSLLATLQNCVVIIPILQMRKLRLREVVVLENRDSNYNGEIAMAVLFILCLLSDYVMLWNKWPFKGLQISLYFIACLEQVLFNVYLFTIVPTFNPSPPRPPTHTHNAFRSYFALLPNLFHYFIGFFAYHHKTYTLWKLCFMMW